MEYRLDEGGHVARPLGAGAMAGQEPPGDRARMARRADRTREARETRMGRGAAEPDQALADITWARTPC
ncbi:hypothetical protein [Streptomyces sp. NPDC015345]|uniref:hypothetical protein n=1 Tax=Streptomyces sp. NPDC015345 TaxID=3364953 RepID=UPI0036FDD762